MNGFGYQAKDAAGHGLFAVHPVIDEFKPAPVLFK
jgi:hypothetical protein